jgi:hypothetical protein
MSLTSLARRFVAFAAALLTAALPIATLAHGGAAPVRSGPWSVELTDEWGRTLPTFEQRGRIFVLGEAGQRYTVRVRNGSPQRIEVVVSVDGRDVVDGRPASWDRRGYLVEPYGETTIDGYRLNQASVAAFRFGSVSQSYAAKTGDARDVGVIGVAVFPERVYAPRPPPYRPYPYPRPYWDDRAPESRDESASGAGESAPAAPAPAEAPAGRKSESAPSAAERSADARRPGLGTEFGEARGSSVQEVPFVRASSRPAAVLTLRYDDRRGLLAAGVDLDHWAWGPGEEQELREHANPFRANSGYAAPPQGWRGY